MSPLRMRKNDNSFVNTPSAVRSETTKDNDDRFAAWIWRKDSFFSKKWDAQTSFAIHRHARLIPAVEFLAKLVNFWIDDATYITVMAVGWLSSLYFRSQKRFNDDSCVPEAFCELYLRFMMWTVTESILKLILQCERPPHYHKSSSEIEMLSLSSAVKRINLGVMIPGDQYSFPSGHTLRAFATVRILVCDPLLNSQFGTTNILGPDGGLGSHLMIALATATAWARVALGKHSVHDVIGGMMLGLFFGDYFERIVGDDGRALYQILCLSYFTVIGIYCFLDLVLLRRDPFGIRAKLGFVDYEHELLFIALPVLGSWIFAINWTACN